MKDTVPYFQSCLRWSFGPFVIGCYAARRKDGEYGARGRLVLGAVTEPRRFFSRVFSCQRRAAVQRCSDFSLQRPLGVGRYTGKKQTFPIASNVGSALLVPKIFYADSCCHCFKQSVTLACSEYVLMSRLQFPAASHNPRHGC